MSISTRINKNEQKEPRYEKSREIVKSEATERQITKVCVIITEGKLLSERKYSNGCSNTLVY